MRPRHLLPYVVIVRSNAGRTAELAPHNVCLSLNLGTPSTNVTASCLLPELPGCGNNLASSYSLRYCTAREPCSYLSKTVRRLPHLEFPLRFIKCISGTDWASNFATLTLWNSRRPATAHRKEGRVPVTSYKLILYHAPVIVVL